jgi:hypothetical protein
MLSFPIEYQVGETREETVTNIRNWLVHSNPNGLADMPIEYFEEVLNAYVNRYWRPVKRQRS